MEQSRKAVESYWRSRMVDGATSDEDKITPIYKLEEICDLLRSSHVSIVKEVSEFILKRLEHKSPIVKQKALRVIKYAVGKSGAEFRREMQRNSVAVRQLIHYRGQPDPLKADSLNKAVRETAQEALSALFSSDESNAVAPKESSLGSRIQGFGNTNYEMPSDDKDKATFFGALVEIGDAVKQGMMAGMTKSNGRRKNNETGSYRSPNLQRSLNRESDYSAQTAGIESYAETRNASRFSENAGSGNWGEVISVSQAETSSGTSGSTYDQKTHEEKLLETLVTSGGVRLQPTRDALHVFLVEASKLNALSLAHAFETKLRSPMWQVRIKALCVLEALLRKKDDDHFSAISSYFSENKNVVVQCSESPQASLREKANKVLSLLGGEHSVGENNHAAKMPQPSMMPDLIDTGDSDDILGVQATKKTESGPGTTNAVTSAAPLIDDLFRDADHGDDINNGEKLDDDPFADVSFHTGKEKDNGADIFSGQSVDKSDAHVAAPKTQSEPFDFFNSSSEVSQGQENLRVDVHNLMGGLSINGNDPFEKLNESTAERGSGHVDSISSIRPDNKVPNISSGDLASQAAGINSNPMIPLGALGSNFPPGLMFNPALASHPMYSNTMGSFFAQQQLLATMSNFHQVGNLQSSTGINAAGSIGGNSSPLPDVFNPGMATQPPTSLMSGSKGEETKAFDFISDHLAAARDPKHVI